MPCRNLPHVPVRSPGASGVGQECTLWLYTESQGVETWNYSCLLRASGGFCAK
ncbi:hypothetical protein FHT32_005163 [Variovorax sp. SG517]|nr:hypothetical protein [Variovorax sp. SG517]